MTWPAVLEMMMGSITGIIDTAMIGRLGKDALSAVALTLQPRLLFLCLFTAWGSAVTAVIGRLYGENKEKELNKVFKTAWFAETVISVLMAGTALLFSNKILLSAGGKKVLHSQTLSLSLPYFHSFLLSLPFQAVILCTCAALRGIGKTKLSFIINIITCTLNLAGSYLFIQGRFGFPALGIKGAAAAHFISLLAGAAFSFMYIKNKSIPFDLSFRSLIPENSRAILKSLTRTARPMILEQLGMRAGYFLCGRILFSLNTVLYAASHICQQMIGFTFTIGEGLGNAANAAVSQSAGKKNPDKILSDAKVFLIFSLILSLFSLTGILILRNPLASFFIGKDTAHAFQVISHAEKAFAALAFFQPFQILSFALAGCLRGMGEQKFCAKVSVLCAGILRPVMTFAAVKTFPDRLSAIILFSMLEMAVRSVCYCYKLFFKKHT